MPACFFANDPEFISLSRTPVAITPLSRHRRRILIDCMQHLERVFFPSVNVGCSLLFQSAREAYAEIVHYEAAGEKKHNSLGLGERRNE